MNEEEGIISKQKEIKSVEKQEYRVKNDRDVKCKLMKHGGKLQLPCKISIGFFKHLEICEAGLFRKNTLVDK